VTYGQNLLEGQDVAGLDATPAVLSTAREGGLWSAELEDVAVGIGDEDGAFVTFAELHE
jgi:hypothetical protein